VMIETAAGLPGILTLVDRACNAFAGIRKSQGAAAQ